MTDLGKMGSKRKEARGLSESAPVLWPAGPPILPSLCCRSLSDEQEDESMETTGKVEPV